MKKLWRLVKVITKVDITKDFLLNLLQIPEEHYVVVVNSDRVEGQAEANSNLLSSFNQSMPALNIL